MVAEIEEWRNIPGWEGLYQVSDQGRVRSYRRGGVRLLRPGVMNRFGHVSVALGRGNSTCVHALVMAAFVGPRPAGHDVAHINGVGGDNRLENLRYVTRRENNLDIARHDRRKYTREQVQWVKTCGLTGEEIRSAIGMSPAHVSQIRLGRHRTAG